jgi:hypothetical protein
MTRKRRLFSWMVLPLLGCFSLVWFFVRVIPKPSRAAYPCMRVAAPLASTFVLWLLGTVSSLLFIKRARAYFRSSGYLMAMACLAAAGITGGVLFSLPHSRVYAAFKTGTPIGEAKGANPGRVVWVHDSNATNWAGSGHGHWWESNHTNQTVVDQMLSRTVRALAGKNTDVEAWDTLFRYYNGAHGRGNNGYISGEKIAIKVNLVGCCRLSGWCAVDTNTYRMNYHTDYTNASPQMMRSLLRQLVNIVGVSQSDISIGDPSAYFPGEFFDSLYAEFPGVKYVDCKGTSGRTKAVFSSVPLYWSCRPAGVRQDYVPEHFAEATYVINLATMKSHAGNGITLCAKNHYGSLIRLPGNSSGLPIDSGYYDLHPSLACLDSTPGSYRALVDFMGHRCLGGKTVLYLGDGLYEQNHNVDTMPHTWSVTPFNGGWTSSLFASQDPVAIECVLYDLFQLDSADIAQYPKMTAGQDYLVEAAQAGNPPSGTFYDPDHATATERLPSLGVFEHWNNAVDRKYSRNLGTGNGIELVFIDGATNRIRVSGRLGGTARSAYSVRALPATGTVELYIPRSGEVALKVFDGRGRLMGTAVDGFMAAGNYRVDLTDRSRKLSPGFYSLALYQSGPKGFLPAASCTAAILGR